MKKLFFFLLVLFLAAQQVCLAQATSLDEYNYVTVGYKLQTDQRAEMRKGYFLKDIDRYALFFGDIERSVRFRGLYRDGDKKPCAVMAVYERRDNGKSSLLQYFCLPIGDMNGVLWDKTLDALNKSFNTDTAKEFYSTFLYASLKIISKLEQE